MGLSVCAVDEEGGATRETSAGDNFGCHCIRFDACGTGLEPIHID